MSYCELKSLLTLTHSLDPSWSDRSVTVQKARDPIASENRIFIWNTPKYSGCEDELAVQVQTPEHSGGADIIGRVGADLIGSAEFPARAENAVRTRQGIHRNVTRCEQPPDLED